MRASHSLSAPGAAALLAAATALGGCVNTSTYGTGEAPELAIFREVTGGIGAKEKPKVEYQPRAPLVMPPSAAQLPPPVATASAADAHWPIDPDQTETGPKQVDDGREGISPEEYRRLKPLAGVTGRGPIRKPENERDWMYGAPHRPIEQKEFQAALDTRANVENTERRFLTDPPVAVRAPAPTAQTQFEDIDKKRDGSFLTRWLVGS